jgi:hypothetical protein
MATTQIGTQIHFGDGAPMPEVKPPEGWSVVKVKRRPNTWTRVYIRKGKDFAECYLHSETGELLMRALNQRPT